MPCPNPTRQATSSAELKAQAPFVALDLQDLPSCGAGCLVKQLHSSSRWLWEAQAIHNTPLQRHTGLPHSALLCSTCTIGAAVSSLKARLHALSVQPLKLPLCTGHCPIPPMDAKPPKLPVSPGYCHLHQVATRFDLKVAVCTQLEGKRRSCLPSNKSKWESSHSVILSSFPSGPVH